MADFIELTCPICGEDDFDATGLSLHFLDCAKANDLRQNYYEAQAERHAHRAKDRDEWKTEAKYQQERLK